MSETLYRGGALSRNRDYRESEKGTFSFPTFNIFFQRYNYFFHENSIIKICKTEVGGRREKVER